MKHAIHSRYALVVQALLERLKGQEEQLWAPPDSRGNHCFHVAAELNIASLPLVRAAPSELLLHRNGKGHSVLALIIGCYHPGQSPGTPEVLQELLSRYSAHALAEDMMGCRVGGKDSFQRLCAPGMDHWLPLVLCHVSERGMEEVLLQQDSEGQTALHYLSQRKSWLDLTQQPGEGRSPPLLEELLDYFPEDCFLTADKKGNLPWFYIAQGAGPGAKQADKIGILRVFDAFTSRTPRVEALSSLGSHETARGVGCRALVSLLPWFQEDEEDTLRRIIAWLPDGSVDASLPCVGMSGAPLLTVCGQPSAPSGAALVLAEHMGEEGFMRVNLNGETFVHIFLSRMAARRHRQQGTFHPAAEQQLLLDLMTDYVAATMDVKVLLDVPRSFDGVRAADYAEMLKLDDLAAALRFSRTKAALA